MTPVVQSLWTRWLRPLATAIGLLMLAAAGAALVEWHLGNVVLWQSGARPLPTPPIPLYDACSFGCDITTESVKEAGARWLLPLLGSCGAMLMIRATRRRRAHAMSSGE